MARRDRPDDVPKARVTRSGLREVVHLLRYLRPYRGGFAAALTALFVNNLLGLLFPFLAGRLVDAARPDAAPPGRWGPIPADLDSVALLLVGVLAVRAALAFAQTYWLAGVGERSLADLRRDAYGHLLSLPMGFFNDRRVGELAGRLAADVQQVQDALTSALPQLLRQLVLLVGGVALLAVTSGRLTLVMLASVPVLVTASVLFGRAVRRLARDAQDRLADANVVVEETLQGVAGVKAFGNESFEVNRYTAGVGGYVDAVLRGALYRGAFSAFVTFALFGAVVLVLWSGANQVRAGSLTFGDLTQFLLYTLFVGGAVGSFAELYAQLQRTVGATERVRDLLREVPEVGGPVSSPPADGAVSLEGVEFAYPSRADVPVLRGLTLAAKAGERVALVGPSGAGKSTVVNLLLRFFDPQAGAVRVGGRDARDYALSALRSRLAVVPQDVLLFGGSIGENIAYGRPGATTAEVEAAAREANAHDFIAAFPDGYGTLVGERGVKLSGGQRQRVAIARAILRDPAVLLLDEATSALDAESERLVQEALDRLMRGRTSVIVAHRLSTVRRADRIFVVKDGRVAESGTHDELLARPGGAYRALTETQLGLG